MCSGPSAPSPAPPPAPTPPPPTTPEVDPNADKIEAQRRRGLGRGSLLNPSTGYAGVSPAGSLSTDNNPLLLGR